MNVDTSKSTHVLELVRVESAIDATFGILKIDERVFCVTLERPWSNNLPNVSCVPDGRYLCAKHESPRFGSTFKLLDVPGRSDVLFHWGNVASDSQGCIILGRYFGFVSSKNARGVLSSLATFKNFMNILRRADEFQLLIRTVA